MPGPISRDEAEALVNDIALAMNNQRKLQTRIDAAKLAVDQEHKAAMSAYNSTITASRAIVQLWAEANPQEFTQRKSVEFAAGLVGFRTGTPKLKPLRKATWDAILEAMRGIKRLAGYIRTKEEINKEQIIADYAQGVLIAGDLEIGGMKVVQEESFYIEPKLTEPETRQVAPVKESA